MVYVNSQGMVVIGIYGLFWNVILFCSI